MPADGKRPEATRVADLIGRTPLLSLDRIAAHVAPGVRLFAKAEWLNPAGSVKDRAALGMLRAAQKAGLTNDRTLLDATSGNTGIAIAMLAAAEGYRAMLCVPANLSSDRRRMLEAYGAKLILTPASDGTDGAQTAARHLGSQAPRRNPFRGYGGCAAGGAAPRAGGGSPGRHLERCGVRRRAPVVGANQTRMCRPHVSGWRRALLG